jgi:hypothetical protein
MNPLYDPYKEMLDDLDPYALSACQLRYFDHLQDERQEQQQQTVAAEVSTFERVEFDDIKFDELIPLDKVEEDLLQEIYQKFPRKLLERVQSGQRAAELAIHFYDLVTLPESSSPLTSSS